MSGLAIVAVLLALLSGYIGSPLPTFTSLAAWLEKINAEIVSQIVPSIVVAIFVFAVGTAFVVAQIVPPARGTRAATTLQGRRMFWTIAPAPGLIIGSVLAVLVDENKKLAGVISLAILLGAIVYLLVALGSMLAPAQDLEVVLQHDCYKPLSGRTLTASSSVVLSHMQRSRP
jgi:hypothetical protein